MLTLVASLWWWWVLQQIVSIWSSSQWGMWVWWWWFLLPLESSWSNFDNCWHAFAPCFFLHWAETTYGEYMRRLIESWNYISVCVARNIKDGLIPTLLEQGHLPPYQEAQSPIPLGFEHIHGWGIRSFSGQPGSVPHHHHSEKLLPYILSKSILFSLKPLEKWDM